MEPAAAAAESTSTTYIRRTARPQSASVGVRRPLLLRGDDRSDDTTASGSGSGSASTRRVYSKPRPPSASAPSTLGRRPRPQPVAHPNQSSNAPSIAPQILREEIETQCRVTRRAQREYNALRVQRTAKLQEIALLQRHLQAFDVDALPSPHRTAVRTAATSTATGTPRGRPLSALEQLKDETRRLESYKKTLRAMLDRIARHMHFLRANAERLETLRVAAAREAALCQDKVAQDKSLCAELDSKRQHLTSERAAHKLHAQQLLASLRSELESRTRVSEQRQDADRRREEMLRLVESRPPEPTVHNTASVAQPPLEKRRSYGRRDSFRMLMDESLRFFGSPVPGSVDTSSADHSSGASTAAMAVALSSRRLQSLRAHTSTAATETIEAAMRRETFFQVYETQYERILEQTGESDLAIVLERFRGFRETQARLEQIEKDLAVEDATLDALRAVRAQQLEQLRLSGIAEVEKRKKIRDFLEHQFLVKSAARAQAKDVFVDQLKTFSYVQQGILNITELLKCLDDKFSPPALATASAATSSASPIAHRSVLTPAAGAEIDWLQSLLYSCRTIVRGTATLSLLGDFTPDQVARLGALDPTLGLAAGEWTVERLKHHIPGGNVVWTSGPGGQYIEDAENSDKDEAESDGDDQADSDDEVDDRTRIKYKEVETLAQADLLIRTLDSRQQFARQEQSMRRARRAFGFGDAEEETDVSESTAPAVLDDATKLAAVHAFFREKRLREKHELQDRREVIASLGGLTQISNTPRMRGSVVGATMVADAASGVTAMASIVAEMRASAASRRPSVSTGKAMPSSSSLTVFTSNIKSSQPRKRMNAVSFSVPQAAPSEQSQPLARQAPIPADEASQTPLRTPMRPATASSLSRRGSNGQTSAQSSVAVSGSQPQVGKFRPDKTR